MSCVWIVNQYASTPRIGPGGRTHHLARELVALGHTVYSIGASWHHYMTAENAGGTITPQREPEGYSSLRVSVPSYAHAHDKKRILNWFLFANRLKKATRGLPKPDVVYFSSPSIIPARAAQRLASSYEAKFVFEARDIWPLTLTEIGGLSKNNPLIRYMQGIEHACYKSADLVVSPLTNAQQHMETQGLDLARYLWMPNGYSKEELEAQELLPDELQMSIPSSRDRLLIGYTGTMGNANALEILISAFELVRKQSSADVGLVFAGKGAHEDVLKKMVSDAGLEDRCVFLGVQPKNRVASVLSYCDVGYVGWHNSPLYKFGISPNKLIDYMFAGLPILHAYSGSGDPVEANGLGWTVPAADPPALAEAIVNLSKLTANERKKIGENGKQFVRDFEYGILAQKLSAALQLNT